MPACDVCSAMTTWEEGTGYTAAEFRKMVALGLGPHETMLGLSEALGTPRQQAISQWKNGLVAQSTTGWLLCPECATTASRFMRKPAGGGPAGHVLTETLSVDKLFPPSASGSATRQTHYASTPAAASSRSPMMDGVRVILLAFALLSLVAMLVPMGRSGWVLALRLVLGAGVAVLAYRYAANLNRSGLKWGIFSFLLPAPTLFVLPFLKAR
jgi:hypothetical protein